MVLPRLPLLAALLFTFASCVETPKRTSAPPIVAIRACASSPFSDGRTALAFDPYLGGEDAKGYGWTGSATLLGSHAELVGGHRILIIHWDERRTGYSTGWGGDVDMRSSISAICILDASVRCPVVLTTDSELIVTHGQNRDERQALWSFTIAADGTVIATLPSESEDQPTPCVARTRLF